MLEKRVRAAAGIDEGKAAHVYARLKVGGGVSHSSNRKRGGRIISVGGQ